MTATIEVTHVQTSQSESATTLRTVVESVRRVMQADTASILSFSLTDETINWEAATGFTTNIDYAAPVFRPLGSEMARRALENKTVAIIKGIGSHQDFPADEFPIHNAEGIRDIVIAPLPIMGTRSGALIAGYRSSRPFTDDEKRLLQGLAEIAAVALDSARLVESVSAAEKIWEQTFDAINESVLVYDRDDRIVRCNARAAELMDANASEVIGLLFTDAFSRLFGRQASDYYFSHNRTTPSSFEVETPYGRRYSVSIFPMGGPDSATVMTLNDVTRISEMQDQLVRSRRLGTVGQLAAGVAHEINNPLAAIATCAEAIIRNLDSEETPSIKTADYLEEIVRQSLRCKEITRGLLDLTQQRRAKLTICDLNAVTRECIKVSVQQTGSTSIEFEVRLDETIGEVATDPSMVRQILDNLLTNAVDAVHERGGKVSVTTRREADRMMIEIADNGSGIPADLLPRIFEPFVSTKRPGKGYGLGLAICATLAESIGARLTVESKEGKESKFRLWIPRRAPEQPDMNRISPS